MKKSTIIILGIALMILMVSSLQAEDYFLEERDSTVQIYRDIELGAVNQIILKDPISEEDIEKYDESFLLNYVDQLRESYDQYEAELPFKINIEEYRTPDPLAYERSRYEFIQATVQRDQELAKAEEDVAAEEDQEGPTETTEDQEEQETTEETPAVDAGAGGWEAPLEIPFQAELPLEEMRLLDLDVVEEEEIAGWQGGTEEEVSERVARGIRSRFYGQEVDEEADLAEISAIAGYNQDQATEIAEQERIQLPIYYRAYFDDNQVLTKVQAFDALGTCYVLMIEDGERVYKRLEYHYYPPKINKLILFVTEYYGENKELAARIIRDPETLKIIRIEHFNPNNMHPNLAFFDVLTYSRTSNEFELVSYDILGRKVREAKFDDDREQVYHISYKYYNEGYTSSYFNEENRLLSIRYFNTENMLIRDEIYDGIVKVGYKLFYYNENGVRIKEEVYGENDNLETSFIFNNQGILIQKNLYENGEIIETIDYND